MHKRFSQSILTCVLCCVVLAACGHLDHHRYGVGPQWEKTELYFGMDRTSAESWKMFVNEVIAAKFPKGFTILDAEGYWLPSGFSKPQHEFSKLLLIVHPGNHQSDLDLEFIRSEYKRRFRQQSVLRVDYPVTASF